MELKPVYSTTLPLDAQRVRLLLQAAGIDAQIDNENAATSAVMLPTSAIPLVISVPASDADRAADAIRGAGELRDPDVAPPADDLDKDLVSQPCPSCRKTLELPAELKGSTVDCPFCGRSVVVA